jgi:RimJ/RimL family protein N-acetyltransferase
MKILETNRLVLRKFEQADIQDFVKLCANEKAMFWLCDGHILMESEAIAWFNSNVDNYENLGYGTYAVDLKSEGKFIGFAGFFLPEGKSDPELMIALDDQFWHQGLATETGKALIEFAQNTLKVPRITAGADQGNIYSLQMIRRLGFVFEKTELSPANLPVDYYYLEL